MSANIIGIVMGVVQIGAGLFSGNPWLVVSGVLTIAGSLLTTNASKSDDRDSTTYGFQNLDNPVRGDTPISIVYGDHLVRPTWLQCFVSPRGHANDLDMVKTAATRRQLLTGLLAVGEGSVEDIYDIKLNDQPVYEEIVDDVLEAPDGSRKEFTIGRSRIELYSVKVRKDGVDAGWVLSTKADKIGTGNGSRIIWQYDFGSRRVNHSWPIKFYNINPTGRTDKATYEWNSPDEVGAFPIPFFQGSEQKLLIATQRPMVTNKQLWMEYGEWIPASGIQNITQDEETGHVTIKFATAPAKGSKIVASYRRRAMAGVYCEIRLGTRHQLPILGVDNVRNSRGVGVSLSRTSATERETTGDVDDIFVDLASGANGFTEYDDEGDHGTTFAHFRIEVMRSTALAGNAFGESGKWVAIPDPVGSRRFGSRTKAKDEFRVDGNATSQLFWSFGIRGLLEAAAKKTPNERINGHTYTKLAADFTRAKYKIRLTRTSWIKQSQSSQFADDLVWMTFQEVLLEHLNLPGIALLYFRGLSGDQLNGGAPTVTCRCKGRNDVLRYNGTRWAIPSAAHNTAERNRVWAVCDLLVNKRFGSGRHYTAADIDGASAKAAADWLDRQVNVDGNSQTQEVASRLDIVLDVHKPTLDHCRDMLLPGRVWLVMQGNKFKFVVDDVVADNQITTIYEDRKRNQAVEHGTLAHSRDPIVSKPTELQISFKDEEHDFEERQVWITLKESSSEERRIHRLTCYGTTRRSEVTRYGMYTWTKLRTAKPFTVLGTLPGACDLEAGNVVNVISDRSGANQLGRIRRHEILELPRPGFVRLDLEPYVPGAYGAASDEVRIIYTGLTRATGKGANLRAPGAGSTGIVSIDNESTPNPPNNSAAANKPAKPVAATLTIRRLTQSGGRRSAPRA